MFELRYVVVPEDIDAQGHINNVAYLRLVQEVAVSHWRSVASEELQSEFSWVVLRHEIDYRREGFVRDELTLRTWVGERTRTTWERMTSIERADEVLASARSVWCLIDRKRRRPGRINERIIASLG